MLRSEAVFRRFAKFTGRQCARAYLLIKLQAEACNFIKKEALAQMFSIEFCEMFSSEFSPFFCRTPLVFASIRF